MISSSSIKSAVGQVAVKGVSNLKGRVGALGKDDKGAVAITFGLSTFTLVLFIGGAVDFGRWQNVRSQTRAAMDAAVLAGARTLQVNGNNATAAVATARSYYKANVVSRAKVKDDSIDFAIASDGKTLTATGNARVVTPFLAIASIKSLPVLSTTGAEQPKASTSLGGNSEQKVEISMMLDTTGSMAGQKIVDLKSAANDLIDIVLTDANSPGQIRVGLAPFAEAVRPGGAYLSKVRGTYASTYTFNNRQGKKQIYKLSDCVSERDGAAAYSDMAPYGSDMFGAVYTANGACTTASQIVPLTTNKSALKSAINGFVASGTTAGHIGTAWAWNLLSPKWSSIWPSDSRPAAYEDSSVKKIAILMTDGEYNTEYDSRGLSTAVSGAGAPVNGASDIQARAVCEKMKAEGIEVYTVGFQLDVQSAVNTLRDCATDPSKAYVAQDGSQLRSAFRDIAIRLSPLHLTN